MTTDSTKSFWTWFDGKAREAEATEVGKIMVTAGYQVEHMGGGCLAWVRKIEGSTPELRLVICDEGNGLGTDAIAQLWLVGVHGSGARFDEHDGDCYGADAGDLFAALAWCEEQQAKILAGRS